MRSRMRKDIRGKTKENDLNKLLIDDISDDEALSFWSRIAVSEYGCYGLTTL